MLTLPIDFERPICGDLVEACSREWLETNGIGGFACSTIIGLNTRRYHSLLTAATKPPLGRIVLLSKIEETLVLADQRFELGANQYQEDVIHPRGFDYLASFRLDPFPVFRYRCGDLQLEKTRVPGSRRKYRRYRISSSSATCTAAPARSKIRPLVAFRDYHSTHSRQRRDQPRREYSAGPGQHHALSRPAQLCISRTMRSPSIPPASGSTTSNTSAKKSAASIRSRTFTVPS